MIVVSVAVFVLYEDSPFTVKVLPISDVLNARLPGRSLPLVTETLIGVNGMLEIIPAASVTVNVELAPDSSVKNLSFSDLGSAIRNVALLSRITSVKVAVS